MFRLTTPLPSPAFTALRVLGTPLVTLALLLAAHAAQAQTVCSKRDNVVEALGQGYKEAPVSIGLGTDGRVFEIFSSGDGATWTLVATRPDGTSCIVAAGVAWQQLPAPIDGPEA